MASLDTLERLEPLEQVVLSPIEAAFWRIEEKFSGAYRSAVLFRLDGRIEAGLLAAALRHLQWRHPKLRSIVVQRDGELYYQFEQTPPPIPIEIKDYAEKALPWREETRRLLERGFPAGGPLAAVSVLHSFSSGCCDLLFLVHHAIADGLSGITLVHDLLTEYARVEVDVEAPPRPALPAVTVKWAKKSGGLFSKLWVLRRFMRLQGKDRSLRQTSLPGAPDVPPQSQWAHWVFSRGDTLRLVQRCRKEQISVIAALVAAVCCGLMDCLQLPEGVFKCQFPLNVREALEGVAGPVTVHDLGCFVSIMTEYYELQQQPDFWSLARHAHEALQKFMRSGGPSFAYNMAALASTGLFERAVPRLPSADKRVTLLANNYGVLNVSDAYGSLRPRECTLTFKNYVTGPSLLLQALVMGQQLNVGVVADSLDPAFWERLQLTVRGRIQAAIGVTETASVEA